MPHHETLEIPQSEWRDFFDSISSSLRGRAADISLLSPTEYIHQSRVWQLHGVTYDPHDDALIVSCREQEHVISNPGTIRIERLGHQIESVEVTKQYGEREIIQFVEPLLIKARQE